MHLLYLDFSEIEQKISFDNIPYEEFFSIFEATQYVGVFSLYAHSVSEEYDETDFDPYIEISKLQTIKKNYPKMFLDSIRFQIDFMEIEISDEDRYLITSRIPFSPNYVRKIWKLIDIDEDVWNEARRNNERYLLVEKNKIVDVFTTFDDFLNSKYSDFR